MLFGRFASNRNEARYPTLWDGLVGAWCPSIQNPSGNRLYDLSGRANHGTLTNMDAATDWVRSDGRGALDFDGVNDFVLPTIATSGNTMTLACWFFARSPSTFFAMLMSGGDGQSALRFNGTTSRVHFVCTVGANYVDQNDYSTSTNIISNQWYHVAGTYDGSRVTTWLNGRSDGSFVASGALLGTPSIRFGARSDGFNFNGQLDDIRIYNRALSPAEIRLLAAQRGIAFTPVRRVRANTVSSGPFRRRFQRSQALIGGGVI